MSENKIFVLASSVKKKHLYVDDLQFQLFQSEKKKAVETYTFRQLWQLNNMNKLLFDAA